MHLDFVDPYNVKAQ